MMISFIIIWIPQFAYWYYVSGKIFYFSYGAKGAHFYFNNPQITDFLFSYKKGWYVYTPVMLFATFGLYRLFKLKNNLSSGIFIILFLNIYILSSWWSWWFGGSFGTRSMVDIYGLMAIPLAALIEKKRKIKFKKPIIIILLFILTFYNQFQIQQYRKGAIHYWWMNKEAYWTNFMHLHPTCKYWKVIQRPNYDKARKGIYEYTYTNDKQSIVSDSLLKQTIINRTIENEKLKDSLIFDSQTDNVDSLVNNYAQKIIDNHLAEKYYKALKIEKITIAINACASWQKELRKKAKKSGISFQKAVSNEAKRIYENYAQKYEDTFE